MTTIAFFSGRRGVGTTSLVYHLAWMYAELGVSVLAVDFDPQADLSDWMLTDDLEKFWLEGHHPLTVFGGLGLSSTDRGQALEPHVEPVGDDLGLLVGDPLLAGVEAVLAKAWIDLPTDQDVALRTVTSLASLVRSTASQCDPRLVLIDLGPTLSAINRSALLAADSIVISLAPDLPSLQALRSLGPTLMGWRREWLELNLGNGERNPSGDPSSTGSMTPAGYLLNYHAARRDRPSLMGFDRSCGQIADVYHQAIVQEGIDAVADGAVAPSLLAVRRKPYRSLMALAQEARKPMFHLRAADGALGGHAQAVQECHREYAALAKTIASRCGVVL